MSGRIGFTWHDRRVRLAANLAIDRKGINDAERLGYSRLTGSMIPSIMDFALRIEPYPFDPARAKRLLAEAGYPAGFDAGDLTPLPPFNPLLYMAAPYEEMRLKKR